MGNVHAPDKNGNALCGVEYSYDEMAWQDSGLTATCPWCALFILRSMPVNAAAAVEESNHKVATSGSKSRVDLLPFDALLGAGDAMRYGASVHGEQNWRTGAPWSAYLGAALRHLFRWGAGQDNDPDSGLSHLDHATCNLLILRAYTLGDYKNNDDRGV